MDPYLEGPLWTSFHALFVPEIIRLLNPKLRPRYVALSQQYQQVSIGQDYSTPLPPMYPDVGIVAHEPIGSGQPTTGSSAPVQMTLLMPVRVPHSYIQIRDVQRRRLVTVIEFLSPANKFAPGRRKYQRKRQRLLDSRTHLMEIDLLHLGRRIPVQGELPQAPYFVFLSRVENRPTVEIWPVQLAEALPQVKVPLAGGDPDVDLELQQAFTAAYDLGGFEDLIDYRAAPPVALPPGELATLDVCLKSSGKRAG
jgi:hypothetical protein